MPNLSIATFVKLAIMKPVEQSILIRGDHGIGKSQITHQIAKMLGEIAKAPMPIIDVRISQMSDGDMIGLPSEHKMDDGRKATKFLPPEWYMMAASKPCVLFLDEFNRGSSEVMQACFQIVLDRMLNGVPLHPQTRVFAAINLSHEYNVNTMDPALLDRLWVVDLNPGHEEWLDWARKVKISSEIVNFIAESPVWLDPPKKNAIKEGAKGRAVYDPNEVHPSRRSWEMLDKSFKHMSMLKDEFSKDDLDLIHAETAGRVGTLASAAFIAFLKKQDKILGKDIVNKYCKVVKKKNVVEDETLRNKFKQITTADQINSIVESVVEHINSLKWPQGFDSHLAANVETFFGDLPAEIFFAAYKAVAKPRENIQLIAAINNTCGKRIAQMFHDTDTAKLFENNNG